MTETSPLSIVGAASLHISIALLSLGALIACAITLSTVDDIYGGSTDTAQSADEGRYRGAAGWLLFVAIMGLITHVIFMIVSGLYSAEVIKDNFAIYGVAAIICTILLGLALISGGGASAANAGYVQSQVLGGCDDDANNIIVQEICDNFEKLRNSQAAAAALSILGALNCAIVTIIMIVKTNRSRNST